MTADATVVPQWYNSGTNSGTTVVPTDMKHQVLLVLDECLCSGTAQNSSIAWKLTPASGDDPAALLTIEAAQAETAAFNSSAYLNLDDQDPEGSSALRKLIGGSETLHFRFSNQLVQGAQFRPLK
ncbi:MAG: hypothetical protein FRX49_02507 [Trebouxia sp. A1-2]|nr:MAG: hypothetical protein FRX49_02507 [Trebouxia sp. A1-2]